MARKILFLSSNPTDLSRLRLDKEAREIEDGIRRSIRRDEFIFYQRTAVRARDLRLALLEHSPHIVHFSGHGGLSGIALEDDQGNSLLVAVDALKALFELCANNIECVLLSACYSEPQAEAISEHIPYVIGMKDSISDTAAITFAIGFYDALGAGKTIEEAYHIGCNAIALEGIPEEDIPCLKKNLTEKSYSLIRTIPELFLEVSAFNEPDEIADVYDTSLTYSTNRSTNTVLIQKDMGYITTFETGGPIFPLNYLKPTYCPFLWHFPVIDLKILNNSEETIYLTEVVFDIEKSCIDTAPLLTIRKDTQRRNAGNLIIVNEGSTDIIDLNILFYLLPGEFSSFQDH